MYISWEEGPKLSRLPNSVEAIVSASKNICGWPKHQSRYYIMRTNIVELLRKYRLIKRSEEWDTLTLHVSKKRLLVSD